MRIGLHYLEVLWKYYKWILIEKKAKELKELFHFKFQMTSIILQIIIFVTNISKV
jgi:hypothetical protein